MDFFNNVFWNAPIWAWCLFFGIVVVLMVFDLGVLNKTDHEIGIAESLWLSAFYISVALIFGSGWAWLVGKDGKLSVGSTPNQDNPLMDVSDLKGTPLLGLDVWEHAYYLKYQNRRADYIASFWSIVDWDRVAERFNYC